MTIPKAAKLPPLLILPSPSLTPAGIFNGEKANQNNSVAAPDTGRKQLKGVPYGIFHPRSYGLIGTKPSTWAATAKKRTKSHLHCLVVRFSPKACGGNLALPQHLSPTSGIPKDRAKTAHSNPPGQAVVGWDNATRSTVHSRQEGKGRQEFGRGNKTAVYTSRHCLPPASPPILREPGGELRFSSLHCIAPSIFSAFTVQAPHRTAAPHSHGSPQPRTGQPLAGRSPP